MPVFRILHVSDYHFCIEANRKNRWALWVQPRIFFSDLKDRNRTKSPEKIEFKYGYHFSSYLRAPAEDILRLANDDNIAIDAIVCTGDLATTGIRRDLDTALQYFESGVTENSVELRPGLKKSGRPLLLMPGNHDRYTESGDPGNGTFDLVFANHWATRGKRNVHHVVAKKQDHRIIFVAADFCLRAASDVKVRPQKWGKLGQGKCYHDVLSDLIEHTKLVRSNYANAAIIWTIHFPTVNASKYVEWGKYLNLIDAENLTKASAENKVQIIVSGHLHKQIQSQLQSGYLIGAGSGTAVDVVGSRLIHILNIATQGDQVTQITRENLRWDQGMFVLDSTDVFPFDSPISA